jgi:hypothetical protein
MMQTSNRIWLPTLWCGLLMTALLCAKPGRAAEAREQFSNADAARFMAGLEPSADSPLRSRTNASFWRRHARDVNRAWKRLDKNQLSPIRAWSRTHLKGAQKTMLYMFSGPDFLYANAFFPNAERYVFVGLEPIGTVPELMNMSNGRVAGGLGHVRSAINTVLNVSFFITKEMRKKLTGGRFAGVVPILYVFLARAGEHVEDVSYLKFGKDGTLETLSSDSGATGVKITYRSGPNARQQVLYYFRTDLSNGGLERSGFVNFLNTLGPADSFVKSASYLMHSGSFRTIREQLLTQSVRLVQDDSGIPLRYIDRKVWSVTPHGRYLGPISIFSSRYQRDMARLFRSKKAKSIDFGLGYRWRPNQSNIIVGTKKVP